MSQTADVQVAGATVPHDAKIAHDQPCYKCGYNLRGLTVSGQCPECGSAAADSLKGTLLQCASPEYLAKIHSGLSLILNAILISICFFFFGTIFQLALGKSAGSQAVLNAVMLAISAMSFFGYFRATEPDPMFTGSEKPDSARSVVRITAVTAVAVAVVQLPLSLIELVTGQNLVLDVLSGLLALVAIAAWLVQFFAMMNYTRWLGKRVPDAFIVKNAGRYRWLLPLLSTVGIALFFLGPLIALILYWNLLDRLRKHVKSIRRTGMPASLPKMAEISAAT
ncbi:MAG TPA: hypothetical protein VD971_06755 [Phycisphaerales bacterium]|nr:hypothetical protein [Phycisphaerales bacterium]